MNLRVLALFAVFLSGCSQNNYQIDKYNEKLKIAPPPNLSDMKQSSELKVLSKSSMRSREDIKNLVFELFVGSSIDNAAISVRDTKWVSSEFGYNDHALAPGSQIYAVDLKGNLTWPFPGELVDPKTNSKEKLKGNRAVLAIQPDNGRVIAATIFSK